MSSSPVSSTTLRERSVPISSPPSAAMSAPQLTPRSKIKAMLAAVDDDSSDEGQAARQQSSPSRPRPGPRSPSRGAISARQLASEDSEDDAQDVIRPRGRMASRMQAGTSRVTSESKGGDEAKDVSAYERVKKQLLDKPHPERRANESAMDFSAADDADKNEASLKVKPPRRRLGKPRAGGTDTPKPAMRSSPPSSPGLFVSPGLNGIRLRSSIPSSPGLFVSPGPGITRERSSSPYLNQSDSDLPEDLHSDPRFLASVAQEREERLAKAAAAAEARKLQAQQEKETRAGAKSNARRRANSDSDSAAEQRLTQQVRPSRKASKKAREEISRETQRMARNMHLQHEARTKKKITKQSLFERFNYKPAGSDLPVSAPQPPTSSTVVSDVEGHKLTEASSPPTSCVFSHMADESSKLTSDDINKPDEFSAAIQRPTQIGGNNAIEGSRSSGDDRPSIVPGTKKPKRILNQAWLKRSALLKRQGDSDSEVEIVPVSKAKAILSEHMPMDKEDEAHSLLVLRACAHLNPSDDRPSKVKGSMSFAEMQVVLKRRAREQGALERLEHLEELRKRGIVPQTVEERAREEADIETLVEKARLEAEQLSKMEKDAAKKEGGAEEEIDLLDDSTEDEEAELYAEQDYEGEAELSGSDEEGGVEGFVDEEADEAESGEEDGSAQGDAIDIAQDADGHDQAMSEGEDDPTIPEPMPHRRQRRAGLVISDDEDETMEPEPAVQVPESAKKPPALLFPTVGAPMMPLSEIFAGTMADTQIEQPNVAVSNRGPADLDFLRQAPALTPPTPGTRYGQLSQDVIRDSQPLKDHDEVVQGPQNLPSPTQISEFPDPTQDAGFSTASPTRPGRIDTVSVETGQNSPIKNTTPVKKRGRFQKRARAVKMISDEDDEGVADDEAVHKTVTAFDALFDAANRPAEVSGFNKKKSRAKEMVDEQAEESEDEYAGLGGASEDGHSDDSDADMSDLVNDEDVEDVREEDLVALMADKDRAEDKRQIEQIYNDVTTGALRRKRGAANNGDYDLSDSDADQEVRRRMKRREEAKLRRALLADENIEKIATNPKKSAFFRSIEDRDERRSDDDDDEEMTFLDEPTHGHQVPNLQDRSASQADSALKTSGGSLKRKYTREDSRMTNDENRPPSHSRWEKRPRTVSDIRETLSAMIAPPNAIVPVGTYISDDDEEEEMSQDGGEDRLEDEESHIVHDGDDDVVRTGGEQRMAVTKTNKKRKMEGVSNPFEIARRAIFSRSVTVSTSTSAETSSDPLSANTNITAPEPDLESGGTNDGSTTGPSQDRHTMNGHGKVIDRLSVIRQKASSSTSTRISNYSRLAFHTSTSSLMMKGGRAGPMSRFLASTSTSITGTAAAASFSATTTATAVGIGVGVGVGGAGPTSTGPATTASAAAGNGSGKAHGGTGHGNGYGHGTSNRNTNGIVKVKGAKKNCSINWFNASAANRRA